MTLPLIIAEAGVNHNGDLGQAREMVAAAAEAGADYVKFQSFSAESLVSVGTKTADYQRANTGENDQTALLQALELARGDFAVLAEACRDHRIGFMVTAFDMAMVADLIEMGMDRIKVASGELTNDPALVHFAGFGLPVLLSTGMATMAEVIHAVDILRAAGAKEITPLHCTSLYPAPEASLNLRAMVTVAETLGLPTGYSDHSLGDHAAIAAVALGAVVIEKHFTLDRSLQGPDHRASMEPDELASMISKLHSVRAMLGDGEKKPAPGEAECAALVRRSWHATRNIAKGSMLGVADIALKRPAEGLPPSASPVGLRALRPLAANGPITANDVEGV